MHTPFKAVSLKSTRFPILLRTYTTSESDISAIHAILSNPENTALDRSPSKVGPTREGISSFVHMAVSALEEKTPKRCNFVIVDVSDPSVPEGKIVGLSGYGAVKYHDDVNGRVEIDGVKKRTEGNVGVMLNPEARGKGFGMEAFWMSVSWGFEKAGFDEVSVTMLESNKGMRGIMDKALKSGFPAKLTKGVLVTDGIEEVEMDYRLSIKDWFDWVA